VEGNEATRIAERRNRHSTIDNLQSAIEMGGPPRPDRLAPATATGRVKDLNILAKRNGKMKRFVTAFGISACLLLVPVAYAGDYTWKGGSTAWETGTNWNEPGFPGSGTTSRVIDRVTIADDTTTATVLFGTNSGKGPFQSVIVQEMLLDTNAAAGPMVLNVAVDRLRVNWFQIKSGTENVAHTATLDMDSGQLNIRVLDIVGNTVSDVILQIDADVTVASKTLVTGDVDLQVTSGFVLDLGRLVISSGKIF
jgi:hypothetical protein